MVHTVVFIFRLPFFLGCALLYFGLLHHLPLPAVVRKLLLWGLLFIPGIWWVDLQLDGVKRGSLSQQPPSRVPHAGSVIAANFTSPIDALYLAAVFDPVFTVSYPGSRKVRRVGLLRAILHALSPAQLKQGPPSGNAASGSGPTTTDLRRLLRACPGRMVVVFPECATTNGKGILPLAPALATLPAEVRVFPVSIRYTPPDITTPVPGTAAGFAFLWKLLSRPVHGVRVRIAEGLYNSSTALKNGMGGADGSHAAVNGKEEDQQEEGARDVTLEERRVLDRIAEALARLGRNKRVGLDVRDKAAFVEAWRRKARR